MVSLSLIVVNYNDNEYLINFFNSLKEQNVELKIIFIDNNSKNDPKKLVLKYVKFFKIEFIRLSRNIFFSPANNIGLRKLISSDVDIIGILNPDMYFEKGCFSKILNYFNENPSVVALQPRLFSYDKFKLVSPVYKIGLKRINALEKICENHSTDALCGAATFVRKEALLKSGLFYEPFYHYSEDVYLTHQLKKFGKTMWLFDAVGYHRVGVNLQNRPLVPMDLLRQLKTRNDYILSLKTFFSHPQWLIMDIFNFFKEILFFIIGFKDRKLRLNYIKGYLWGFSETFFHLFNNEKYLNKGLDFNKIPKSR
ncbi:MAG: glycosyltransferase family 2 protein [Candidatus ainarchaeum sp.]|nr:glycosyltransferase family 2 protein [Candidatus ainarchaeum sp.]